MSTPNPAFDPEGVQWRGVSPLLIRVRTLVAACWLGALLLAGVGMAVWRGGLLWVLPAALAVLLAWVLWIIPRHVRAIGYAEREDDLLVRKGVLMRSMVVVPYGRLQYVDLNQGPIARRLGLASVELHTASSMVDAEIPGLPHDEAARLRDQLSARGEARLAGL